MNETDQLQSAVALRPPPESAADAFESLRESLMDEHNRQMSARPDIDRLIGDGNRDMMLDNSRNFCRFMSAMTPPDHSASRPAVEDSR